MALIAAGYLAGLGPFGTEPAASDTPFRWRPAPRRIAAALATLATALLVAWAIWQPEASDRATNDALALADERKFDEAIQRTKDAEDLNPLTPDPLLVRASIDTHANRMKDAERSLQKAVIEFPGDPQTWYRLAAFELGTLDAPERALETIRGALYIDPHSRLASELFLNARARLREKQAQAEAAAQPDAGRKPARSATGAD
jgi:tetratricopeptide (TPR) repeat protein